ncbi:MAG: Clp protease N-terminal domain-containing protein [Mycobacteriales bacterium]
MPAEQQRVFTALQEADLAGLCQAAWQEHGPEGDERPAGDGGSVFGRFTDRARQVVVAAQEEARDLGHHYIGTDHLLLGILRGTGVAARALSGMTLEGTREATLLLLGRGADPAVSGHIPFTPRARDVLQLAAAKATELGDDPVGTHHLLLALADEDEGVGAQLLTDAGLTGEVVRERVLAVLAALPTDSSPDTT